ncbi:hypothetical protein [Moorena producens]|uniref:hypothetical protein n=1 Tax=Moorena producens TaxID=1155739 RepID=UPI003C745626
MGQPRGRRKGKQRKSGAASEQGVSPCSEAASLSYPPHPTPHTPHLTSLLKTYPYEDTWAPLG